MENVAFSVKLKDSVTQPATDIAAALRALASAAKAAGKAVPAIQLPTLNAGGVQAAAAAMANLTNAAKSARAAGGGNPMQGAVNGVRDFSAEIKKAQAQLSKLRADPAGYKKMLDLQKQLNSERAKIRGDKPQGLWSSFTDKLPFRTVAQYTQAEFAGSMLAGGASAVANLAMKAVDLWVTGVRKSVELVAEGFQKAIEVGSRAEVLALGEESTLGKAGAAQFRDDASRFASQTGLDDDQIREMLLPLRNSGFSQDAARSAFAAASDVAVMRGKGGDVGSIQDALTAFETIMLKGGIGEKQLVGLHTNPKEVYESVAKDMGVSLDSAKKMVHEGGMSDPLKIINAIERSIAKREGGTLGTATDKYSTSMQAQLAMLRNLPDQYLKTVAESPAWRRLTDAVGRAVSRLDPSTPEGKKIVEKLGGIFERIADWISQLASDEGLTRVQAAIDTMLTGANLLVSAVQAFVDVLKVALDNPFMRAGAKIGTYLGTDVPNVAAAAGLSISSAAPNVSRAQPVAMNAPTTVNVYNATPSNAQQIGAGIGRGVVGTVLPAFERAVAEGAAG